ncbi:torsin-1A-interacting protein 2-like isoform X2 [Brienomyrus brachyistius]|uniref:torsin-1A-interacting protein 2-like isoform X2 n=1 Tax=Brienomyrus brachyistius TaxID=42636 RepID=UPI0020B2FA4E|nr:torsin-1A-interacting protein 2-like isoform X2 [Brienomyrus brachyistius]
MNGNSVQKQLTEPGSATGDVAESMVDDMRPNPVDPAVHRKSAAAGDSSLKSQDLELQPDSKDGKASQRNCGSGDSSSEIKTSKTETPEGSCLGSPEPNDSGARNQPGERQEAEADAGQSKTAAEDISQDPEDKGDGAGKKGQDLELQPDSKDGKESQRNSGSGDSSSEIKTSKTETPEGSCLGSPEPNDSGARNQPGERQEAEADQSKTAAEDISQDPEDKGDGAGKKAAGLREQEDAVARSDEAPAKDSSCTVVSGMLYLSALVAVLAVIYIQLGFRSSPPPVPSKGRAEIFHEQIGSVKLNFPSQRAALWQRSEIHLTRHLDSKRPTEPVSMILTSGRGAEKTLRCLAVHIAKALSAALNASVLEIDGTSKALLDSDQVKLDIDEMLKTAFGMNKGPAVIHRFEEFPPGSTLIFYRYCDHENAAFKEASLIFTVLLEEVEQLEPQMSLSDVEEMVQDHVKDKFLSSTEPAAFDKMDVDKLGGLWSRISHLVLPVAAEKDIELEGCRS